MELIEKRSAIDQEYIQSISAAQTFILAMLLNPSFQRKAQGELDTVIGKYERLPTKEDIGDFEFGLYTSVIRNLEFGRYRDCASRSSCSLSCLLHSGGEIQIDRPAPGTGQDTR